MASHSGRPGAIRKKGTKKGAQVGTGGHSRRRLEGKGPTPKAEDRTYHPAYKRKVKREAREAQEAAIARARAKSSIRVKPGHELIAGRNPVAEAARASVPIERVFILDNVKDDRVEEVVRLASAMGAPVYEVTRRDLDVATDGAVHQGVAIEVRGYEYADASELIAGSLQQLGHPLLVALDQVTDPHNLGAVLRSAGAFGADGVIIPERRSAGVNTTAWKVSAGAAARVPVARATNLVRALEEAKSAGYFVVGLDGGGDAPLRGLSLADGPLVIVTGAEGAGLSRLVRETCDQIVSIPIASTVESLNAAAATGLSGFLEFMGGVDKGAFAGGFVGLVGSIGCLTGGQIGLNHAAAAAEAHRHAGVEQSLGFVGSHHGTAGAAIHYFAAAAVGVVVAQQAAHAAGGLAGGMGAVAAAIAAGFGAAALIA